MYLGLLLLSGGGNVQMRIDRSFLNWSNISLNRLFICSPTTYDQMWSCSPAMPCPAYIVVTSGVDRRGGGVGV